MELLACIVGGNINWYSHWKKCFPGGSNGKEPTCARRSCRFDLGQEDLLEKEMTAHSSFLTWEIPWTEEPAGLWSVGSQKI